MSRHGPRGPYYDWKGIKGRGFGQFIKAKRRARGMTQAAYAKFLDVGLRTLIEAEQGKEERLPWSGSAIGWGMGNREFSSRSELERAYEEFRKGAAT